MRSMFESATWPMRKLVWKMEEKLLWPIADRFRRLTGRSFAHAKADPVPEPTSFSDPSIAALQELVKPPPESEPLQELAKHRARTDALRELVARRPRAEDDPETPAEAVEAPQAPTLEQEKRPLFPRTRARMRARMQKRPRLGSRSRELTIVLGTVAVAIAVGIGFAKVAGGPSIKPARDSSSPANSVASVPNVLPPASTGVPNAAPKPSKLEGVAPTFKPQSKAAAPSNAGSATTTVQGTSAKPSSIPAGVAGDMTALKTARDFANAFVLYEVGKSNPNVKQTFGTTATPALAKALRDRPPRLPSSVKVPTAKVENVVLGADSKQGNQVDASVSLLRLGSISELRLTLTRHNGNWLVSEVRG